MDQRELDRSRRLGQVVPLTLTFHSSTGRAFKILGCWWGSARFWAHGKRVGLVPRILNALNDAGQHDPSHSWCGPGAPVTIQLRPIPVTKQVARNKVSLDIRH